MRNSVLLFRYVYFYDFLLENEHHLVVDHTDIAGIKYSRDALDQMDQVFGIFYEVPNTSMKEMKDDNNYPAEVMPLVCRF